MFVNSALKSAFLPLSLLLLIGLTSPCFAVELLGNWTYRQSGGDDLETQSEFQQRYQLGVGPALSYQPTPAITVSGGVGYRNTQRDYGDGMESVEQVSPFGQVSLINDIFFANLSANSYTTMAGSDNSSAFWNANLGSAWDIPLWPSVQFTYGEDYAGVDRASLFDDTNGKNKNTTVAVDWDLLLANLYYEYSINEFINNIGESQSKATTHYARFETNGRFWANRVSYNLTQQYREVSSEFNVGGSEEGTEGDSVNVRVEGQTFSRVVNSITGPDPEDVVLEDNPLLNDGIYDVPAVTVETIERGCFGFKTGSTEQVDTLYLTLDPFTQLGSAQAAVLQWDLYLRNPVDLSWELATAGVSFAYNVDEKRFELNVNISEPEFMVVVTNPASSVPLAVTEMEAFQLITEDTTTKATSYKTNAGVNLRITRTLGSSFSFSYEHDENSNAGIVANESDKITYSGRLQWSPVPYVTPSLGYSEYREERTGRPDVLNRLYSATVSTRPLPSLNFSLGYTHNDRYADNDKAYQADTYSFYTKAMIYPDLNASLTSSYTDADTLREDPDSGNESFVNRKSISNRLDITAKLYRNLTAYATGNYSKVDDSSGKKDTANTTFSLNYRPSDILSLSSSYSAFFLDDERTDGWSANMELYLLRTYKSRLSMYVSHAQANDTIDNVRMIGSWDISDYLTLTTNGTYTMAEINSYNFYVSLAMRL